MPDEIKVRVKEGIKVDLDTSKTPTLVGILRAFSHYNLTLGNKLPTIGFRGGGRSLLCVHKAIEEILQRYRTKNKNRT